MPAYIIVDITVHDPERYEEYKTIVGPTMGRYGGRYVVRGGAAEVLEGDRQPNRVVVLEFPSVEQARAWWGSPEYAPAKAIRQAAAKTEMVLIEGA